MIRVAVVGAGGFVGARMIEMAQLRGGVLDGCELVPVVRRYRGLGRLARLGPLAYRMADASKPETLREAFAGCDVVVNLTMGDDSRIAPDVANLFEACARSGISCFIHFSSAEVFGRCDRPRLSDDSDWQRDHWMAYAREKGRAEDWLRRVPAGEGPSVVTLRPGLVWGPRSSWVAGPAQAIRDGAAFLFDGGRWACNLCYVDNLAYAVTAVARGQARESGFYNIGDPDRPDWRGYYLGLAAKLGMTEPAFRELDAAEYRESLADRLIAVKRHRALGWLRRRLRSSTKQAVNHRILVLRRAFSPPLEHYVPALQVGKGMWWLQTTRYLLPTSKFQEVFKPTQLSFREGLERTGAWLRFAGFAS